MGKKQTAAAAGVHYRTICRWAAERRIRTRRLGGRELVAIGDDGLPIGAGSTEPAEPSLRELVAELAAIVRAPRPLPVVVPSPFVDPLAELDAIRRSEAA